MIDISSLIAAADAYKAAAGLEPGSETDKTVSHRVFGDTKKLGALRAGTADITVGRFNAAMHWFRTNANTGAGEDAAGDELRRIAGAGA